MTDPKNGPTLREYLEGLFAAHKDLHADHDKAHNREHEFAEEAIRTAAELAKQTKSDSNEWRGTMKDREATFVTHAEMKAIDQRMDALEDKEITRSETERLRLISDAEKKEQLNRRQLTQQFWIATGVGIGYFLLNQMIRLMSEGK